MSIYDLPKTDTEIKADEIRRCADYRKGAGEAFISAFEVSFNDFWNNSIVTPQEQCDAFGTDAAVSRPRIESNQPHNSLPTRPFSLGTL